VKKHSSIIQFLCGAAVLFAILFQSFDSLGHLEQQFSQKHCNHKYAANQNEIGHSHHDIEKCFACEFTFSHFTASDIFSFTYKIPLLHQGYTISKSREITQFFRGSLFSHRGPPAFIA
jgi:hypothetical protein